MTETTETTILKKGDKVISNPTLPERLRAEFLWCDVPLRQLAYKAADEIDRLRIGIRKVLLEGVQKTEGPYSWKNNKCKHGRYGYEGCDSCTDEFLEELLNG